MYIREGRERRAEGINVLSEMRQTKMSEILRLIIIKQEEIMPLGEDDETEGMKGREENKENINGSYL